LITHFVDYSLEVLWYDAQGCIRSDGLDIVRQLPLLIFLITTQQHSSYLYGVLDEEIPAGYLQVGEIARRFQLVGRMTYCSYLMETPTTSAPRARRGKEVQHRLDGKTTYDATHFFKVAWPEDSRRKEGEIIEHIRTNIASLGTSDGFNAMKFTWVSTYNRRPYILKEWVNRVQIKEIKR
jgi:hypothetical protein